MKMENFILKNGCPANSIFAITLDFFVAKDRNLYQTSLSIQRIDWSVGPG